MITDDRAYTISVPGIMMMEALFTTFTVMFATYAPLFINVRVKVAKVGVTLITFALLVTNVRTMLIIFNLMLMNVRFENVKSGVK